MYSIKVIFVTFDFSLAKVRKNLYIHLHWQRVDAAAAVVVVITYIKVDNDDDEDEDKLDFFLVVSIVIFRVFWACIKMYRVWNKNNDAEITT